MGQWRSGRGYVSDGMADVLGSAFRKMAGLADVGPRMIDLADAIEFVSGGVFKVEFHPDAEGIQEEDISILDSADFETIPNRGQIHDPETGKPLGKFPAEKPAHV